MKFAWDQQAWDDYLWWQAQDKRIVKRINQLLQDIVRNGPGVGLGKPEPLRFDLKGNWSRRITEEHRLVYAVAADGMIIIRTCRGHYE